MSEAEWSIFLDASVLFAGCHSVLGGSGLVIDAAVAGSLNPWVSHLVVAEALRAIRLKSSSDALRRLHEFMACPGLRLVGIPTPEEIRRYLPLIAAKDCHVLASAVTSGAKCLLTLDRKHFCTRRLREADLGLTILTPGDFLRLWRDSEKE